MKNRLIVLVILFFQACSHSDNFTVSEQVVVSGGQSGCAFFTTDYEGRPVLCWTEEEAGEGLLYYATFNPETETFGEKVAVASSRGTKCHPESANKVAFKSDGTVVGVYERKHPHENNKYAGSVFYSQSFDGGKTWSAERQVHTDTVSSFSRSFFDIAVLPDGEVGAVWLDGRLQLGKEGSSLFFSKTREREGFQPDYQIGETVCECCRTDLSTDSKGIVHVVYRDIETSVQGQMRDFVVISSNDNGNSFSTPKKVSEDRWMIEGCPHTGATITTLPDHLAVAWFTGGGTPGLYITQSTADRNEFQQRLLLTPDGRHPQITSYAEKVFAVWDEMPSTSDTPLRIMGMAQSFPEKLYLLLFMPTEHTVLRCLILAVASFRWYMHLKGGGYLWRIAGRGRCW